MGIVLWASFGFGALMWLAALALFFSGSQAVGLQLMGAIAAIACFLVGLGSFAVWLFLLDFSTRRQGGKGAPDAQGEPGMVSCPACTASNFAADPACRLCRTPLNKG